MREVQVVKEAADRKNKEEKERAKREKEVLEAKLEKLEKEKQRWMQAARDAATRERAEQQQELKTRVQNRF